MTLWVCRAGSSGEYENYFLEKNVITITWSRATMGLIVYDTKEKLKTNSKSYTLTRAYTNSKPQLLK
jgi:predicted Mrr-cat superfamily restriction endonuclease